MEKELFDASPQNVEFKHGLAVSYSTLGNTHTALGNLERALTFFEQYNQLEKELFEAYPQNVAFKYGLALSYQRLGLFYEHKLRNLYQAQEYYRPSRNLLLELVSSFPGHAQFKQTLDWVTGKFYLMKLLSDEADE